MSASWTTERIAEERAAAESDVDAGGAEGHYAPIVLACLDEIDRLSALVANPFKLIRDQGWTVREPSPPAEDGMTELEKMVWAAEFAASHRRGGSSTSERAAWSAAADAHEAVSAFRRLRADELPGKRR